MKVMLRSATLDDLPTILTLYLDAIHRTCVDDYNEDQRNAWALSANKSDRWKQAINEQYFLIAEAEEAIVGFGSLKDGSYIDFLFVHPDYGRQGIADQIFHALYAESKRMNRSEITGDISKTARPFFE